VRTPSEQDTADQTNDFRRVIADVMGELRSAEIRDSYAALGLEELMDQHIDRLTDSTDPMRPSRLARLTKLYDAFINSVESIKATPPELFRRHDPDRDANTAVE